MIKKIKGWIMDCLFGDANYDMRCTALDVLIDMDISPNRFCEPQKLKKEMESTLKKNF